MLTLLSTLGTMTGDTAETLGCIAAALIFTLILLAIGAGLDGVE